MTSSMSLLGCMYGFWGVGGGEIAFFNPENIYGGLFCVTNGEF